MPALHMYLASQLARLQSRVRSQRGQGMVEYGLILVLVSLVVVVALLAVGSQISTIFNTIVTKLQSA
jgi:pilus assembly protein Flp/PilA